jgi:nitrite reductase (NADH) large subunit
MFQIYQLTVPNAYQRQENLHFIIIILIYHGKSFISMKILIIGNNVAGTFSAQNIRNLNDSVDIEIFSEEKYPYYTRIKLPEFISNKVSIDNLIVFKDNWYESYNINLHLEERVEKIAPNEKLIYTSKSSKPYSYDKLIIATGSNPNIPPIKNAREMEHKGLFTLRNIKDALEIKDYISNLKSEAKAIVIGGGLLGLELANQINQLELDTTVIEVFPRLLPKQLDDECSSMLKDEIEDRGIKVVLDTITEEILGNGRVEGLKLKDGRTMNADIVFIQAGIRPEIKLAQKAGIKTNRGIIVDEFLQTSEAGVYAVGDCIEYNNQTWGIIPACMEQSKIISASVLEKKTKKYAGTTPKNTLKIVGLDLTSIGIFDPSKEQSGGWDILKKADKKDCCYEKIVLKDNRLKGAILFGDNTAMQYVTSKMEQDVDTKELKNLLDIHEYVCSNCGTVYDEAKRQVLFKDLPDSFICPNPECNATKKDFKQKL